jgi:hypothetical protein
MNLRELMTEQILFAISDSDLAAQYNIVPSEIETLSDLDFLELYQDVTYA